MTSLASRVTFVFSEIFWTEACAVQLEKAPDFGGKPPKSDMLCSWPFIRAIQGFWWTDFTSKRFLTVIHDNWRLCQCSYPAFLQSALLTYASGSVTWRDTFWGSNVYYKASDTTWTWIHPPKSSSVLGLSILPGMLLIVIKQNLGLYWQKWALSAQCHRVPGLGWLSSLRRHRPTPLWDASNREGAEAQGTGGRISWGYLFQ